MIKELTAALLGNAARVLFRLLFFAGDGNFFDGLPYGQQFTPFV